MQSVIFEIIETISNLDGDTTTRLSNEFWECVELVMSALTQVYLQSCNMNTQSVFELSVILYTLRHRLNAVQLNGKRWYVCTAYYIAVKLRVKCKQRVCAQCARNAMVSLILVNHYRVGESQQGCPSLNSHDAISPLPPSSLPLSSPCCSPFPSPPSPPFPSLRSKTH